MFEYLKSLFRKRTPLELATEELVDAEHSLLQAQTGAEWAESLISYNIHRISRLRAYIAKEARE